VVPGLTYRFQSWMGAPWLSTRGLRRPGSDGAFYRKHPNDGEIIVGRGRKVCKGEIVILCADNIQYSIFIFIGYVPQNQLLYINLQKANYILIFKPTLILPDGSVKGNVDAEMVLHTMIEYLNYDKALIVTGDGDFYCLVDYLLQNDKLRNLLIPNMRKYSSLFRRLRPHIVFINELRSKLEQR
jgi:hypothetical protein